jgi:hypothetical protein
MKSQVAQMKKTQSAAIVTTLKNAGAMLDSYLTYHLSIGFSHIFLFFDDPDDSAISIARKYPNVTVIKHDAELRRRWAKTGSYRQEDVRRYVDTELISRQILNTEVAIGLAVEKGIDWLLHIDSDELFYLPGQTVGEHFQSLVEQNVQQVVYLNHEAISETPDIIDAFREVTLFKKNLQAIGPDGLSDEQKAIIKDIPQLSDQFFLFYRNGKSAARVSKRLVPQGSHGFFIVEGSVWSRLLKQYASNSKVQSLAGKIPWLEKRLASLFAQPEVTKYISDAACVLHYPCCGFAAFWDRYVMQGAFSDKWFGKLDIRERIGSFTLDARDVVLSGNQEAAREFYEKRVVIRNETDIERLIESGLGCRIVEPSMMLAGAGTRDSIPASATELRESQILDTTSMTGPVPLVAADAMSGMSMSSAMPPVDLNGKSETGGKSAGPAANGRLFTG